MGELIIGPWEKAAHANIGKWQLAQRYGVSTKSIERAMNDGMPKTYDGQGHARYNVTETDPWAAINRGWLPRGDERRSDDDHDAATG